MVQKPIDTDQQGRGRTFAESFAERRACILLSLGEHSFKLPTFFRGPETIPEKSRTILWTRSRSAGRQTSSPSDSSRGRRPPAHSLAFQLAELSAQYCNTLPKAIRYPSDVRHAPTASHSPSPNWQLGLPAHPRHQANPASPSAHLHFISVLHPSTFAHLSRPESPKVKRAWVSCMQVGVWGV